MIFFSDFQTYTVIKEWLNQQVIQSPTKAKLISIGKTHAQLDINALQIGETVDAANSNIVIQCGIHAREWISPSTCCWIIDHLLNLDPNRDELLAKFNFVIIPVLNADGYGYAHSTNRLWRKNRQPRSGSTCIGTDLNRNFRIDFGGNGASSNPCAETYHGPNYYSGPEALAISNLLKSLDSVTAYIDIHSYASFVMCPYGFNCNAYPPQYPLMEEIMVASSRAIRTVNGRTYSIGAGCQDFGQTSGDCNDDAYFEAGVIQSYCIEAYGTSFTPSPTQIPLVGSEIWAGVKQMALMFEANQ